MSKIEEKINEINNAYQNTLLFDNELKNNSISIYNLINSFNRMHILFKKEYDALAKINVGKITSIESFNKYNDNMGNQYRILNILVTNPLFINDKYTILHLYEVNGEIKPYMSNDKCSIDDDYYRIDIKLDNNMVKAYLDLFEKYDLLFELYDRLKSRMIPGRNNYTMFTKINNSFFDNIEDFIVIIGQGYFLELDDVIKVSVKLGEELDINVNQSLIELDKERIYASKEGFTNILKKISINRKFLENNNQKSQEKAKLLTKTIEF